MHQNPELNGRRSIQRCFEREGDCSCKLGIVPDCLRWLDRTHFELYEHDHTIASSISKHRGDAGHDVRVACLSPDCASLHRTSSGRGMSGQLNLARTLAAPYWPRLHCVPCGWFQTSHGEWPDAHGTLDLQHTKHNKRLDVCG